MIGFPPRTPFLIFNKHQEVPRSAERGGTYVRRRTKRISRRTPCIMSTSTPPQPLHSSRHSARAMAAALPPLRFISMCVYCPPCGYEKSPAGRALGVQNLKRFRPISSENSRPTSPSMTSMTSSQVALTTAALRCPAWHCSWEGLPMTAWRWR